LPKINSPNKNRKERIKMIMKRSLNSKFFRGNKNWFLVPMLIIAALFLTVSSSSAGGPQISAGVNYTAVITSDGSLWTWGVNSYSQLGYSSVEICYGDLCSPYPGNVESDAVWVSVSAGENFTMAVKSDGTLWAWGRNTWGQLGFGDHIDRTIPEQVGIDNDWVHVSSREHHSIALKTDGTLWAWGEGYGARLPDDTSKISPYNSIPDTDWVSVDAGNFHNLALKADGTLWTWGFNGSGQVGDGTRTNRPSSPFQIGSDSWVSIAAGQSHSAAVRSDGIWTWGANFYGQLGHIAVESCGNILCSLSPGQVGTDNDWISVSSLLNHVLALKSDGSLWAWGWGSGVYLGGDWHDELIPVQIGEDTDWVSISAGYYHNLAMKSDGTLWGWGANYRGQLGVGTDIPDYYSPIQIMELGLPQCIDSDNDGFSVEGGTCGEVDCKDDDPAINPDAVEICDGEDNNCNGETDEGDNDGDSVDDCVDTCPDEDSTGFVWILF
jgi:alpha-tubulin suppressor-like RCC1 family protein